MKTISLLSLLSLCLIAVLHGLSWAQEKDWRPVTQDEIKMTSPKVEPDAEAEVIFWEVRVADEYVPRAGFKSVHNHYVRIKIFNERGRDAYNKVSIPFGKIADNGTEISIKDIAARTTRSDGRVLDLQPGDVFDQETVKGRGIRWKSKSFVMPGVEVGSIIEYKWKAVHSNALSYYVRLEMAREIPVQFVKYYIRSVTAPRFTLGLRLHSVNFSAQFVKEDAGFYSAALSNVPSYKEEPYMPPESELRPWILVYYDDDDHEATAEEYWKTRGRETFDTHKSMMNVSDDVKRTVGQIVGTTTDTEEKVRKIYDYCRKSITDIDDDASGFSPEQLKDLKVNKTASDVLKNRYGSWHDIQMVFIGMVTSIGIDARVVNVSSRTDPKFDRSLGNGFFNRVEIVAVKIGNEWKFFDPGSRYLPYGMLPWNVEGQPALVSDQKQPVFVTTPTSPSDRSQMKRTADLRLSDDGTIEGDIRVEYTGHLGYHHKELNDDISQAEREKILIGSVKRSTTDSAEITAISIENVTDPEKPITYSFHLRLPSYAEKTGKRIFLRPNVFGRGTASKFTQSQRVYDISFDHAWSEADDIKIETPAGYAAESLESPAKVVDQKGNAILETKYGLADSRSVLKYSRSFTFGVPDLVFSRYEYSSLKRLFDSVHDADARGIILLKV